jgi:hypothetical protein
MELFGFVKDFREHRAFPERSEGWSGVREKGCGERAA